ncbi:hypothetical protein [Roseisalinus antarcticus]|uniref:Uncharacterized protein n=1 Tax=Roseisalinus antarcticus TaxID=254357 RepID=A0A1Y5S9H9_9RHOB|nr:hypothetical protein [Roseisalinus antarcticus]SLN35264.1 hypothetical protein ROA7023_01269 [Roseisalinus antarcticus]
MSENLHDLLEGDDPVALRRIEKALQSGDVRNEPVDAILSALIWRRCTTGQNGVLGAVLNHDCAARVSVLAEHLDRVGASDAAQAMRDLREEIPLEDERIRNGLIDWVDANPGIARYAKTLNDGVDDIALKIWNFMQKCKDELPDPEIPAKRKGPFAWLFSG